MSSNNFSRNGRLLEKSWPELSRPLTFSDISGPSIPNTLELTPETKGDDRSSTPSGSIMCSSESNSTTEPMKPGLSLTKNQFDVRDRSSDVSTPRQFSETPDASIMSPSAPDNAQRLLSQLHDAKENQFHFQSLPSALLDHDFGFSARSSQPSATDVSYITTDVDENKEKYLLQKAEAKKIESEANIEPEMSKNAVGIKSQHDGDTEEAMSQMDSEENEVNVEQEVYCICKTSDTDRFMMFVFFSF